MTVVKLGGLCFCDVSRRLFSVMRFLLIQTASHVYSKIKTTIISLLWASKPVCMTSKLMVIESSRFAFDSIHIFCARQKKSCHLLLSNDLKETTGSAAVKTPAVTHTLPFASIYI